MQSHDYRFGRKRSRCQRLQNIIGRQQTEEHISSPWLERKGEKVCNLFRSDWKWGMRMRFSSFLSMQLLLLPSLLSSLLFSSRFSFSYQTSWSPVVMNLKLRHVFGQKRYFSSYGPWIFTVTTIHASWLDSWPSNSLSLLVCLFSMEEMFYSCSLL